MKVLTQIKSWFDASVLFETEVDVSNERYALKAALELAVRLKVNLNRASLNGAFLDGASLNGAFLNGASLNRASLNRASLVGGCLVGASLVGASLNGASLVGASLVGASLNRASLNGAFLNGAFLNRASLNGASLNGASLNGAFLDGASLDGASLNGAKIGDLMCLSDLSDAIDLAPMVFREWKTNGIESARNRFGMYKISSENRALIFMCPFLSGGYCLVLERREIWWWSFRCPNPDTVPVLWREGQGS